MADTNELRTLIDLTNMNDFAEELKAKYAKKSDVTAVENRVTTLENNHLEGVKVNGVAVEIANKIVDILIATGATNGTLSVAGVDVAVKGLAALAYKEKVSQADLEEALSAVIAAKADSSTVYTKEQVNGMISSVYKPAGSSAFADLPTPAASILGNVYNVTNGFTTTDAFVEGAGKKHSAGSNVVVVEVPAEAEGGDPTYKFDVLAGMVDLSDYAKTADVIGKVAGATAGHIGTLTAEGGVQDSGKTIGGGTLAETPNADTLATEAAVAAGLSQKAGLGTATATEGETAGTNGLMSAADKTKVDGIAEGATKVEASTTNGNIKINGAEQKVYELPSDVVKASDIHTATKAEILALLADDEEQGA